MELVSGSHSIGQNLYHRKWCPKDRYNMFRGKGNKKLCEEILHEVATRHNIGIVELSVMPDHIHTVVQLPPTMRLPLEDVMLGRHSWLVEVVRPYGYDPASHSTRPYQCDVVELLRAKCLHKAFYFPFP